MLNNKIVDKSIGKKLTKRQTIDKYKTSQMEYNISNLNIIENGKDRSFLEESVEKFIKKMSIIPKRYRKSDVVDINLSLLDGQISIKISAVLYSGEITIKQEANSIQDLVPKIFDEYTEKIAKEIENNRKQFSINQRNEFLKSTALDKEYLLSLDDSEKNKLFNSLIPIFLSGLKGYVKRRIHSAKRANIKALSNIDYEDVVNEVVLRTYTIFKNNIENIKDLNIWLMQTADTVLNEILDNFKSDDLSYEDLVNKELGELEEEFTVDGGGHIVMTEDLDEYEDLGIEEIILASKGENDFVEKLDISKSKLKDKIYDELIKLPLRYQSIYDLYFFEHLDYDEIAIIKDMKAIEIEAIIISIKDLLTEKLFD